MVIPLATSERSAFRFDIRISRYLTRSIVIIFLFTTFDASHVRVSAQTFACSILLGDFFGSCLNLRHNRGGGGQGWDRKRSDNPTDIGIGGVQIRSDPDRPRAKSEQNSFGRPTRPPHPFSVVLPRLKIRGFVSVPREWPQTQVPLIAS